MPVAQVLQQCFLHEERSMGLKARRAHFKSSSVTFHKEGMPEFLKACEPVSLSWRKESQCLQSGIVVQVRDNVFEVAKHERHLINCIVSITSMSSSELFRKTDTESGILLIK